VSEHLCLTFSIKGNSHGIHFHILILIYFLTAIGLTPGGSSTVHIYTQTIQKTTQLTTFVGKLSVIRTRSGQTKINDELIAQKLWSNREECGPCPVFASYALAFALKLREKHGKPSCSGYECIYRDCCIWRKFRHIKLLQCQLKMILLCVNEFHI